MRDASTDESLGKAPRTVPQPHQVFGCRGSARFRARISLGAAAPRHPGRRASGRPSRCSRVPASRLSLRGLSPKDPYCTIVGTVGRDRGTGRLPVSPHSGHNRRAGTRSGPHWCGTGSPWPWARPLRLRDTLPPPRLAPPAPLQNSAQPGLAHPPGSPTKFPPPSFDRLPPAQSQQPPRVATPDPAPEKGLSGHAPQCREQVGRRRGWPPPPGTWYRTGLSGQSAAARGTVGSAPESTRVPWSSRAVRGRLNQESPPGTACWAEPDGRAASCGSALTDVYGPRAPLVPQDCRARYAPV